MKKLFNKIKNRSKKIVIEKIVKSDGSDDAIIPTRGFILTIVFFCAFIAQLILGLWSWYIGDVVYWDILKPQYKLMWHNLTLCAFIFDVITIISGTLLYLSLPKKHGEPVEEIS